MANNVINSPFKFDKDVTRAACLDALGAEAAFGKQTITATGVVNITNSHLGKTLFFTGSSAITATITIDDTGLTKGKVLLVQYGTGALSVVAGPGLTLRSASTATARTQNSVIGIELAGTGEWLAYGDFISVNTLDNGAW